LYKEFEFVVIDKIEFYVYTSPNRTANTIFFVHGIGGICYYLQYIYNLRKTNPDYNIFLLNMPYISLSINSERMCVCVCVCVCVFVCVCVLVFVCACLLNLLTID
jgi:hypothetical protein